MNKIYLETLGTLKELADSMPHTRTMAIAKIDSLMKLNMSWEKLQLNKSLESHPFHLADKLVQQAIEDLKLWQSLEFCDGKISIDSENSAVMEQNHHKLFQSLWTSFNEKQYLERIKLYDFRLSVNKIDHTLLKDKRVIDMGCGHGNFAHAIINAGAREVVGIDFGESSIEYAIAAREQLKVTEDKIKFKLSSVYEVNEPSESFDFAIQNGVFHHLEDEDKAYKEMYRLLKPNGSAWIYTEGEGSIARDLFHVTVQILSEVPSALVNEHLAHLGFSINKRYHLGDSLKAVYKAISWEQLTGKLSRIGFGNFIRLKGGMSYDLDIIDDDPWAKEKFGEGDIRLLATKMT